MSAVPPPTIKQIDLAELIAHTQIFNADEKQFWLRNVALLAQERQTILGRTLLEAVQKLNAAQVKYEKELIRINREFLQKLRGFSREKTRFIRARFEAVDKKQDKQKEGELLQEIENLSSLSL